MSKILPVILSALCILCGCQAFSPINEYEEAVPAEATAVTEAPAYPVTVESLTFNGAPGRVASLSPAVTEIIAELGFADSIVCRGAYCDYPALTADIPETGSSANPDIDAIISYSPELLITQSPIANKDISKLSEAGIPVLTIPTPENMPALKEMYENIAVIFAGSTEGKRMADEALSGLEQALASARGSCESAVLIMDITEDGFAAANGESFAGSYISYFGSNIAALNRSCLLTSQELLAADPQVIFLSYPLTADRIEPETSELLRAFSDGYVYVIDGGLLERPTSRLADITLSISEQVRKDTGGSETGGFAVIPDEDEILSENELSEETEAQEENVN